MALGGIRRGGISKSAAGDDAGDNNVRARRGDNRKAGVKQNSPPGRHPTGCFSRLVINCGLDAGFFAPPQSDAQEAEAQQQQGRGLRHAAQLRIEGASVDTSTMRNLNILRQRVGTAEYGR